VRGEAGLFVFLKIHFAGGQEPPAMSLATLGGRVIACLEARHAGEMADLIVRHGGIAYPAPCLREVHEPDAAETLKAVRLICDHAVDTVVFLTGVGVQTIVDAASHLGCFAELVAELNRIRIAVRGPKTLNAVRRLGVAVDLAAPEPFTSTSLLEAISRTWDLKNSRVLVQCYGAPVPAFTDGLQYLGAEVREVSPYRWERPLDEDSVIRMIEDLAEGWIDVLAATSAIQVDNLFNIARDRGRDAQLRTGLDTPRLCIAAQGIVCAAAFDRRGVIVHVIPPRASMGALIVALGHTFEASPHPPVPPSETRGVVALLMTRSAGLEELEREVCELQAGATLAVLSGKHRRAERLAEDVAVRRGLAVHAIRPAGAGRHPADALVRQADRVVVVSRDADDPDIGTLLRLAQRYAKPAHVVRAGQR
jgi:uroporphyrinogen-III synthase